MLRVAGLACRRGPSWLFRDLSFQIGRGQMVWLRGSNGSGKTSLLRLLAGLAQADEGRIDWTLPPDTDPPRRVRAPMFHIGHLNALKDDLTACESLQFMASLHGRDASRAAALAALRSLGIHHVGQIPVRNLSQGQRRRAALARVAQETEALVWILDEPFDALDTGGVDAVNAMLAAHLERGGAVLLTSHVPPSSSGPRSRELSLDHGASE
jgi:heme exporter protein A